MPCYRITRMEVWTRQYDIDAESKADAVVKFLQLPIGEDLKLAVPGSESFSGTDDSLGLLTEENEELAAAVKAAGIEFYDDVIPAIEDVEELP